MTTRVRQAVYRDFLNSGLILMGWLTGSGSWKAGKKPAPELVEGYCLPEFQGKHRPVVRLYSATSCASRYDGLLYWVNRKTQELPLDEISDPFATSPEFQTT